jgi:hypothetical protein
MKARHFAPLLFLVAAVLTACDNPVAGDRHVHPDGIVIRQNTTTLVRVEGQQVTGQLALSLGQQTGPLTVRFLDDDGDEIAPESGYWLRVTAQPAIATWAPDVAGGFTGTLTGTAADVGTITFEWMHGAVGSGHADYSTGNLISLVVAP